jgi:hypothetical protein
MGVRQGVAMDSLKFHPGSPCPTILCPTLLSPAGVPFQGWPPAGQVAYGRLLPLRTPLAVRYVQNRSDPIFCDVARRRSQPQCFRSSCKVLGRKHNLANSVSWRTQEYHRVKLAFVLTVQG